MMYFVHNMHFASVAHCFQGRFADAKKAADLLAAHVGPHVTEMPMLEGFMMVPALVLVRFRRWDDILAALLPEQKRALAKATWHFARAFAYLAKGDQQHAEHERHAFLACKHAIPPDAMVSVYNTAQSVLGIPEAVLEAKFALSRRDRAAGGEVLARSGVARALAPVRRAPGVDHSGPGIARRRPRGGR